MAGTPMMVNHITKLSMEVGPPLRCHRVTPPIEIPENDHSRSKHGPRKPRLHACANRDHGNAANGHKQGRRVHKPMRSEGTTVRGRLQILRYTRNGHYFAEPSRILGSVRCSMSSLVRFRSRESSNGHTAITESRKVRFIRSPVCI
jgi:hypothetical protein